MKNQFTARWLAKAAAIPLAAILVPGLAGTVLAKPAVPPADTNYWAGAVAPIPVTDSAALSLPAAPLVTTLEPGGVKAMDRHTEGRIIQEFHAENLDLKTALALFASQNNLNIVPDNDVSGTVTLSVHNLPLDQMMRALLGSSDCSWEEQDGLIRVRNTETRTFVVDYLRLKRNGEGNSSATLASATASASGGGSSSGGGGGGGGSGSSSTVTLTADNPTDFWTELKAELDSMLTESGKASLAINKTAGIIQVTDRPSALDKVQSYLQATEHSINRQVDIETKIYDVNLNNSFQFGIEWDHVVQAYEGSLGFGTTTLPTAIGSGSSVGNSALSGLNTSPAAGVDSAPTTLVFDNFNTQAAVNALKTQGTVQVVAAPRIRTLNNQTALIKVGQELPFFSVNTQNSQSAGGNFQTSGDNVSSITVGTILSITPEISEDGWISMDISPVLTDLVAIDTSPDHTATAPVLDTKQASTLVRVRSGTTVVLGGLIQTEKDDNANKVPLLGDIPVLGQLFTGNYHNRTKSELVIFVTPKVVNADEPSVNYVEPPETVQTNSNKWF